MPSIWSPARIVVDIVSMKVFVWVLGQLFTWAVDPNGGILDSHLFFYDRYSDLAGTTAHRVAPPRPTGSLLLRRLTTKPRMMMTNRRLPPWRCRCRVPGSTRMR